MYGKLPSVSRDGGSAVSDWRPSQPFPFEARAERLLEDFMGPVKHRIAYIDGDPAKLDATGWTICRFLYEIARPQAHRLTRIEMTGEYPKEAPWLWRDLYQLDACDRANRVGCGVPRDALEAFRPDGHGWFLNWQYRLWGSIGTGAMGRRDPSVPQLATITPDQAWEQLA